jgi:SAM-dependent methyltransferase
MSKLTQWLDETFYPNDRGNWDDWHFRDRVIAHITPGRVVLDLGAGAGIVEQMDFRGLVDLDPRVVDNPMLDEGRVANATGIPYGDAMFDVVFSDNVLEHLVDPLTVFREVARVLKPGGLFLFKTPNKWHYVPTIARWTPHSFHQFVNRRRGRAAEDTFPTLYRANTKADVARLADAAGLAVEAIERIEGRPEYLRTTAATYAVGLAYERLVNATPLLAPLRVLLIGALRRPAINQT